MLSGLWLTKVPISMPNICFLTIVNAATINDKADPWIMAVMNSLIQTNNKAKQLKAWVLNQ